MSKRSVRLAQNALLFAALGDETRLRILARLAGGGPASIAALASRFPVSRQAITKHLRTLAAAGILDGEREGREHLWTLNPARLREARATLEKIAGDWDDALTRLKSHLERDA